MDFGSQCFAWPLRGAWARAETQPCTESEWLRRLTVDPECQRVFGRDQDVYFVSVLIAPFIRQGLHLVLDLGAVRKGVNHPLVVLLADDNRIRIGANTFRIANR